MKSSARKSIVFYRVLPGLASVVLIIAFTNAYSTYSQHSKISGFDVLIVSGLGVYLLVHYWLEFFFPRTKAWKLYVRQPRPESITDVVHNDTRNRPDKLPLFYCGSTAERGLSKERLRRMLRNENVGWWKRPLLVYTLGLRDQINWVDLLYFLLVRDLARVGVNCLIFVHPEEPVNKDNRDELSARYGIMKRRIEKILSGEPCRTFFTYDLVIWLQDSRWTRPSLAEFLFDDLMQVLFAIRRKGETLGDRFPRQIPAVLDLFCMTYFVRRRSVLLTLFWEGETEKQLAAEGVIRNATGKMPIEMNGNTLTNDRGEPVPVYDKELGINLTDPEESLCNKLFEGADELGISGINSIYKLFSQETTMAYDTFDVVRTRGFVSEEDLKRILNPPNGIDSARIRQELDAHYRLQVEEKLNWEPQDGKKYVHCQSLPRSAELFFYQRKALDTLLRMKEKFAL